ncbi:MAG: hypothetical protein WA789_09825 [Candidatus Acidiferrum sp.]
MTGLVGSGILGLAGKRQPGTLINEAIAISALSLEVDASFAIAVDFTPVKGHALQRVAHFRPCC